MSSAHAKETLQLLEDRIDAAHSSRTRTYSGSKARPARVPTTVGFGTSSVSISTSPRSAPEPTVLSDDEGDQKQSSKLKEQVSQKTLEQDQKQKAPSKAERAAMAAKKEYPKKPKLSKAERRAMQEAQRAAKEAAGGKGPEAKQANASAQGGEEATPAPVSASGASAPSKAPASSKSHASAPATPTIGATPVTNVDNKEVPFFAHLRQYDPSSVPTADAMLGGKNLVHGSFVRLGLRMAEGYYKDDTQACIELIYALKDLVRDFHVADQREVSRDLEQSSLSPALNFVKACRPLTIAMGNTIKFFKRVLTHDTVQFEEQRAKDTLQASLNRFLQAKIHTPRNIICDYALTKIQDNDVIMVHGGSLLVLHVLKQAHAAGRSFSVIVVDSRPGLQGKHTLGCLLDLGIACEYILLPGISYLMRKVTKVFLTTDALLGNGYSVGPAGSSMIAMMAKAYNVPVLLCCETFKFSERVQTDSIVFNELANPDALIEVPAGCKPLLKNWRQTKNLKLLNLVYDVTPPEFVDLVITELAIIPCSSVPVILRIKMDEAI